MLKKAEILEALENGGSIMVDNIYRRATVLDANKDDLGTCRYDTAERIERSAGYKRRKTDWYATWFIEKDWDASSAAVEADTSAALARAFAAAEEAAPAQEAPQEAITAEALPIKKEYTRNTYGTQETTSSAAEAMNWHRSGDTVTVSRAGQILAVIAGAARKERDAEKENHEHCRWIAENVAEYAAGQVYRCPDCGRKFTAPEDCEKYRCPDCGNIADLDEYEQLSLYDYLSDCYDIEYRCDGNREYRSVQIMVACGGPNIYLDTDSKQVELYWWSERATWPLSYDSVEALDEWAEEYWNCL